MGGFDDLRRQAEGILGKETTRRIEKELRKGEKHSGPECREIVSAERIRFEDRPRPEGFKAYAAVDRGVQTEARSKKADSELPPEPVRTPQAPEITDEPTDLADPPAKVHPGQSHSALLLGQAIRHEYIYGMLGLILGLASIIGGVVLCLNGVAGATSWTANLLGLETQLNDAAPGVVLFVVGIFLVWTTKPKVRMRDLRG